MSDREPVIKRALILEILSLNSALEANAIYAKKTKTAAPRPRKAPFVWDSKKNTKKKKAKKQYEKFLAKFLFLSENHIHKR